MELTTTRVTQDTSNRFQTSTDASDGDLTFGASSITHGIDTIVFSSTSLSTVSSDVTSILINSDDQVINVVS